MVFWYRESPRPLETQTFDGPGQVRSEDPPMDISGMVSVTLDPAGRLVHFEAVPPQMEAQPATPKPLDPAPLFTAAGLDLAQFKPAEPQWNPLAASDARAAWTGIFPAGRRTPYAWKPLRGAASRSIFRSSVHGQSRAVCRRRRLPVRIAPIRFCGNRYSAYWWWWDRFWPGAICGWGAGIGRGPSASPPWRLS